VPPHNRAFVFFRFSFSFGLSIRYVYHFLIHPNNNLLFDRLFVHIQHNIYLHCLTYKHQYMGFSLCYLTCLSINTHPLRPFCIIMTHSHLIMDSRVFMSTMQDIAGFCSWTHGHTLTRHTN